MDEDLDKAVHDLMREIIRGDSFLQRLGQELAPAINRALEQRNDVLSRRTAPQIRSYRSARKLYCPGCGEIWRDNELCDDCLALNSDT